MLNKIVSSVLCWVHYAVIIIHKNFLKQNGFGFFFRSPQKMVPQIQTQKNAQIQT